MNRLRRARTVYVVQRRAVAIVGRLSVAGHTVGILIRNGNARSVLDVQRSLN